MAFCPAYYLINESKVRSVVQSQVTNVTSLVSECFNIVVPLPLAAAGDRVDMKSGVTVVHAPSKMMKSTSSADSERRIAACAFRADRKKLSDALIQAPTRVTAYRFRMLTMNW